MKERNLFNSWVFAYFLVVLVFFMSHGLMLFVYGAWWDDMLLMDNLAPEPVDDYLGSSGINNPFLNFIISSLNGVVDCYARNFYSRFLPFLCWLISLSCFFVVLKKITKNKSYTLFASLFASSCGVNKTMILVCCYHYSISISLFMLGLLFFVDDFYRAKNSTKIIVSMLWTLSVLVWRSAVLVIPLAMFISVFCKIDNKNNYNLKSISFIFFRILFKQYWQILLGLLVFSILYVTILAPGGKYAVYYSIGYLNLLTSPITTIFVCVSLLLGYLSNILSVFSKLGFESIIIVVVISAFYLFLLSLIMKRDDREQLKTSILWLACIFLFFSMLPHLFRDIVLSFDIGGYKSRVASLAVFPMSMIYAFFINSIINCRIRIIIGSIIVALSSFYCVNIYFDYEKGWLKNEALADFFKHHDYLKDKTLVCIDNSSFYSSFPVETYRNYEYEGCAKLAYGKNDSTKCFAYNDLKQISSTIDANYFIYINVQEPIDVIEIRNNVGFKSLFYRFNNTQKRDNLKKGLFMYRIETKEDFLRSRDAE